MQLRQLTDEELDPKNFDPNEETRIIFSPKAATSVLAAIKDDDVYRCTFNWYTSAEHRIRMDAEQKDDHVTAKLMHVWCKEGTKNKKIEVIPIPASVAGIQQLIDYATSCLAGVPLEKFIFKILHSPWILDSEMSFCLEELESGTITILSGETEHPEPWKVLDKFRKLGGIAPFVDDHIRWTQASVLEIMNHYANNNDPFEFDKGDF